MDSSSSFHAEEHDDILNWAFSPPRQDSFYLPDYVPGQLVPSILAAPRSSAFVRYQASMGVAAIGNVEGGAANIHLRLIRFTRNIAMGVKPRSPSEGAAASSRGLRRMMKERQRRESLSQSYADLHSMLSCRSKGDKVSIVQSAGESLKELQRVREKLCCRSKELELMMTGNEMEAEAPTIKVQAETCCSSSSASFDSVVSALECLKQMELKATAIRANFSGRDLSVGVVIETEVAKDEVERAMKAALAQVEKEHCSTSPQERHWSPSCQVQNAS